MTQNEIIIMYHLNTIRKSDFGDDIKSVNNFGVSEVVNGVVNCIKIINSETELKTVLPQNMAQRFRAAAAIAQAVKEIGYAGDLGYQSLLYPNEKDIRKLFMFLLEKLPKDSGSVSEKTLSEAAVVQSQAACKLRESLKRSWLPPHCLRVANCYSTTTPATLLATSVCHQYTSVNYMLPPQKAVNSAMKNVEEKLGQAQKCSEKKQKKHISPSLFPQGKENRNERNKLWQQDEFRTEYLMPLIKEDDKETKSLNAVGSTTMSAPAPAAAAQIMQLQGSLVNNKLSQSNQKTEEGNEEILSSTQEVVKQREQQISDTQTSILEILEKLQEFQQSTLAAKSSLNELNETIAREQLELTSVVEEHKNKQRTSDLLPDAQQNVKKLQAALLDREAKMKILLEQWEEHSQPLQYKLQNLHEQIEGKHNSTEVVKSSLVELKEKMRQMVLEASRKEQQYHHFKEQYQNMNKDINRSAYTKRIIDISGKVRKQKQEIEQVLIDTRVIQKEINTLSGKLERTFAVLEGTSFKEAESSEAARPVYRGVTSIHQGCGELLNIIRETGTVQR
ncbi:unnamed protein product, partial [Meganyctiphanes norvegica]